MITKSLLKVLSRGLAPVLKQYVESQVAPLRARIGELEATALKYQGTWERDKVYGVNAGVTHHGSCWIARTATTREPGQPESGWQLFVKRGRDGRDAR